MANRSKKPVSEQKKSTANQKPVRHTREPSNVVPLDRNADLQEQTTLVDTVEERIRTDILSARLKPNERLRFMDMVATYNVSIGTLREALSRLTAERLVEAQLKKGYRVAPITSEDLIDIIESQKALEVLTLRRAIAEGDDEWEAQILAAYHRMIKIERRSAVEPSADLDDEWEDRHHGYHEALLAGCSSEWLLRFCSLLRVQATRYRRWADVPHWQYPTLTVQHEPIVDAALDRDAEKACGLLEEHFDETLRIVLKALQAKGKSTEEAS